MNQSNDAQMGQTEILPVAHLYGCDVIDSDVVFAELWLLYVHPHHQRTHFPRSQPNPVHSRSFHTYILFLVSLYVLFHFWLS